MKSMLVGFIPRGCYELLSMQFKGIGTVEARK